MPSLSKCAKMSDGQVYISLSKIFSSDFYGQDPRSLPEQIGFNEAVRYLMDLVL